MIQQTSSITFAGSCKYPITWDAWDLARLRVGSSHIKIQWHSQGGDPGGGALSAPPDPLAAF